MSAQSKPISEVVKEFEQSLESLRPSTRRVYVAAAKTAIRSAHLELWQCPSTLRLANYWPRSANRPAKEGTHLCFLKFFRQRRARRIGVRRGFSCSAELGDSKTRKGGAFREKPIHCDPARLGADRRAIPGPNGAPLSRGSPAQRSAATQFGRRAQQHPAHHSGEDQSRFR